MRHRHCVYVVNNTLQHDLYVTRTYDAKSKFLYFLGDILKAIFINFQNRSHIKIQKEKEFQGFLSSFSLTPFFHLYLQLPCWQDFPPIGLIKNIGHGEIKGTATAEDSNVPAESLDECIAGIVADSDHKEEHRCGAEDDLEDSRLLKRGDEHIGHKQSPYADQCAH